MESIQITEDRYLRILHSQKPDTMTKVSPPAKSARKLAIRHTHEQIAGQRQSGTL